MGNEEEELTFVFPQNYDTSDKFFGVLEKSGAVLAMIWLGSLLFILSLIKIGMWAKFYTFLFAGLPLGAVMLVGINGDPIIRFIKYIIKFYKNAKIYIFMK